MTTCTFAGHREVYAAYLDAKLEQAIADILLTDTKFVFYTGGMGEFDARCAAAVRTAKHRNPQLDIQLCLVLPYLMQKINEDKDYYAASVRKTSVTQALFLCAEPIRSRRQRMSVPTAITVRA